MSNLNSGVFSGSNERAKKDVTLPSGRKVTILETTGKEEKILAKLADKKATGVMEEYLASVCDNLDGNPGKPEQRKFLDMLTGDRTMILVQSRILTYGNIVSYTLNCPECKEKSEHEVDIQSVVDTATPYPYGDQREFDVSLGQGTLWYEMATGTTEDKISKNKKPDITTKLSCMRLWEVLPDGSKMPVKFENLKSNHIALLRKHIKGNECVLDTSADLSCPSCKTESRIDIIVNPDFLFPNSM